MNQRESRLLILFITAAVGVGFFKLVYPVLIRPVFDYRAKIATADKELRALNIEHKRIEQKLRRSYFEYVQRSGGTNAWDIKDVLYDKINDLIKDAKLKSARVSPKKPTVDRKTKIQTITFNINVKGSFSQCITFIRNLYEIPYIIRFDNLKLTPTNARGKRAHDEVTLVGEIEAIVLPAESRFGTPKNLNDPLDVPHDYVNPPEWYRQLASRKPFTPYFEPSTPRPKSSPPPEPERQASPTPAPIPSPTGPLVDPERDRKVLPMVTAYGSGDNRVSEVLVRNIRTKDSSYVAVGEQLDGGELVLVHPRGVVVHKEDETDDYGYFVYPLGVSLDRSMALQDAGGWPEIQAAMDTWLEQNNLTVDRTLPTVRTSGPGNPNVLLPPEDGPAGEPLIGPMPPPPNDAEGSATDARKTIPSKVDEPQEDPVLLTPEDRDTKLDEATTREPVGFEQVLQVGREARQRQQAADDKQDATE